MSFSLIGTLLTAGAAFILLAASGGGVGLIHGHVTATGCPGNPSRNSPDWGCSTGPLANEPIEFVTTSGLIVGETTTGSDGSYDVILPAGDYHVLYPDLGTDFQREVHVDGWRIVQRDFWLWIDTNA